MNSSTSSLMSEIVSFPVLLQHEESLTKKFGSSMYDVLSWMLYLEEVDSLLESLNEKLKLPLQNKVAKQNQNNFQNRMNKRVSIGGRLMSLIEMKEICIKLQKARNLISERALSLLPGSYKLWRDYLQFRSQAYISSSSSLSPLQSSLSIKMLDNSDNLLYPTKCSQHASRYKSTVSAFERSLVRMNKYPRIWTMFISFVLHNDPTCCVTNIRRLFNRSLLALPATQHDVIWGEYLCFVLGKVPPGGLLAGRDPRNPKSVGPIVKSFQDGIVGQADNSYRMVVPDETVLRVLRRFAHYYNPAARELLVDTCLKYGRYGEAAAVLVEVLNDIGFMSVQGTTRHELWMKLAKICTEHPSMTKESGVNFEGIVRAILNPPDSLAYQNIMGQVNEYNAWKVFDEISTASSRSKEEEGDVDEDGRSKQKKQQILLQESLGEMEGTLWVKLAQYHIRSGEFELSRSIYEEAMESVSRVRDFSLIFDSYMKFEEGVIEALMELMNDQDTNDSENISRTEHVEESKILDKEQQIDDEDLNILLGDNMHTSKSHFKRDEGGEEEENTSADVELALVRAENLMNRRPLLLNRVLLRQNPHNVGEWLKRSNLYLQLKQPSQAIAALEESIKSVSARNAINGSPATLYITLATSYEDKLKDPQASRSVYERICCPTPEYIFKESDDLAQCYAAWVEMELRLENWDHALSVVRRSVTHASSRTSTKATRSLVRSVRLWNLLLDLEESLGTVQTTKDAYNRALELKVASPSHVLNFASYLIDKKYFEESFTAFERGFDLFPFPHPGAKLLWKEYLKTFQNRYNGTKIPRTRELYNRCVESCPPEYVSEFFILYGIFEEKYGLTKRALGVYERMCTAVTSEEKYTAYQLYIAKTVKYLGLTAARPLYERAIAALEDNPAAQMCCAYAKMEASLQEIERSRTAFIFGAQLADPRRNPEYWQEWNDFEVANGNEETFREMLRVKRGETSICPSLTFFNFLNITFIIYVY